jgi:Topoisomerase 6 subunit A/Spo11, Toprim domain
MDIANLVQSVTKPWAKQRKAEERRKNARALRYERLTSVRRTTLKEAAWEVMEQAYLKASSGGKLFVLARQIMYCARPEILRKTGAESLDDQYFTQTILPEYLSAHPDKRRKWDIGYDARGHFEEPHTGEIIPLETLAVRDYLEKTESGPTKGVDLSLPKAGDFPTYGPTNRYANILFIEKEGFLPLFKQVKLAERYDLALMSTKGMSVTASRHLIDDLSARHPVRVLVLRDFDKAGFSIVWTLRNSTHRYQFRNAVEVIDLGLRLEDVQEYGLESEGVFYSRKAISKLRERGATAKEVEFFAGGQRVELNAFTSGDFIEWIEGKLKKHGVKKVIPDRETLEAAYRRALEIDLLENRLEEIREEVTDEVAEAKVPRGLLSRVKGRLKKDPKMSWDEAVYLEVDPDAEEDEEEEDEEQGVDADE